MADLTTAEAAKLADWLESPEAVAVVANAVRADVEQQIAEAIAAERERIKRILAEAKTILAYPPSGQLLDAVTWPHVLDALEDHR